MVFVVELVVAEEGTTLAVTLVVRMGPTSRVRAAEQQICRWRRDDVHEWESTEESAKMNAAVVHGYAVNCYLGQRWPRLNVAGQS
jgi:hypothetical protein